jgi:hypothetical protein
LNHIPAALNVQRVLYASEQEWGFGPGGNEAGSIVYQMPDDVASELQKKGLALLRSLPTGKRQRAIQWLPTPVEIEGVWASVEPVWEKRSPISNYLGQYGFLITVRSDILKLADTALLAPGNFYGFGSAGGVLILIPSERRVIFAYCG